MAAPDPALLIGPWIVRRCGGNHVMYAQVEMLVRVYLAADRIDGVDAAIDSPATRLGQLPRDIRDYVLRPLLWDGDMYLGYRHRNGYRYDVRHTGPAGVRMQHVMGGTGIHHYRMGVLHRSGDRPAMIYNKHVEFWRRGRLHRRRGPAVVFPACHTYYLRGIKRIRQASLNATNFDLDMTYGSSNGLNTIRLDGAHIRCIFRSKHHHILLVEFNAYIIRASMHTSKPDSTIVLWEPYWMPIRDMLLAFLRSRNGAVEDEYDRIREHLV